MSFRISSGHLFAIIITVSAAVGIGWFYDKPAPLLTTPPLQIPDNIDYYLSNVNFRAMNQQGTLHYRLQSPYLEHYIQEDISHIQQPDIQFNGDKSQWFMQAQTGKLQHKDELFELQKQVKLERSPEQEPMQLSTELMLLRPQNNVVEIPLDVTVMTGQLKLQAASAMLDINRNYYQFNRVKAVYQPGHTARSTHEAS